MEQVYETIKGYLDMWKELVTGWFFRISFGWVKDKSEKEDWNGLIKGILYPLMAIFSVVGSLLGVYLLVVAPPVILVLIGIAAVIYWPSKKFWDFIVWLDKRLRFKSKD